MRSVNPDQPLDTIPLNSDNVPVTKDIFLQEYFNSSIHTPEGVGLYTLLQVLRVLFASVSRLPEEQIASLKHDLIQLVGRFSVPPELISTSIDICTTISKLEASKASNVPSSPSKSNKKRQSEVGGQSRSDHQRYFFQFFVVVGM